MVRVWNIPALEVPGFGPRLVRSLSSFAVIGGTFAINAVLATVATGDAVSAVERIAVLVGMAVVNIALYAVAFRSLTPKAIPFRALIPGAAVAAIGFTALITVGSGLVQHQIRNSSVTYGQFGIVIGLVAFLFLLAKISLYGAELQPGVGQETLAPCAAKRGCHRSRRSGCFMTSRTRTSVERTNGSGWDSVMTVCGRW